MINLQKIFYKKHSSLGEKYTVKILITFLSSLFVFGKDIWNLLSRHQVIFNVYLCITLLYQFLNGGGFLTVLQINNFLLYTRVELFSISLPYFVVSFHKRLKQ